MYMKPCFSITSSTSGIIGLCKFYQVVYKVISLLLCIFLSIVSSAYRQLGSSSEKLPIHILASFLKKLWCLSFSYLLYRSYYREFIIEEYQFFVDYMGCKYLF